MSLLENLDKKMKFSLILSLTSLGGAIVFCVMVLLISLNFASGERKKVYVLDGETPRTATLTNMDVSIEIEARAHVNRFHELFFTLAPDDKYIQYNIEKAMYLTDESGLMQYNTLKEKGFYNNLIAASAQFSIITDSIKFNQDNMSFTYYGRQRIERKSSILFRELVTEGNIQQVTRTENNPHGLMITNYRTVLNKDLEYKQKSVY